MIKDYSQLPANKRIVNDKEEDVIISLRDKAIMVPVIIKSKDSLSVKATISEDLAILNNQCEELDLTLEVEGPDITDIVVNLTPNIREGEDNAKVQATIATLSLTGGTEPATYKMEGADAEKFILENNIVKAKEDLTEGTYSLTFSVIDIYDETYTETDEITVLPAYPLITDINLEQVEGLREGEDNVKANAVIGTISSVGGTQPFTYTIEEGDNSSKFSIDSNNLKCTEALTEGEYNIQITSTDINNKTYTKEFTITVAEAYPLITELSVAVTPDLREGQANTEVGSVAATITCEGGTEPIVFTLEGTDAEKFEIQDKNIKIKDNPLTQGTYNITVKAVDENNKTKTSDAVINVAEAFTEITSIKITKTSDLREGEANVEPDAVVATLTTVGGTAPFTYTLKGTDASSFKIDTDKIKVNSTPLIAKTYNITVTTTDANDLTLDAPTTIEVQAAYPEITSFTISPKSGLEEGNANVQADAIVATMSVEGGSAPITYSLREDASNGVDNASFKVDGSNLKVNTTPLVKKDYKVSLKVTDKNNKTATKNITVSVGTPAISALNITPVEDLTAPVEAETVVANLATVGGIAPYTYTLNEGTGDNAEFKIDGTTVKTVGSIDSEGTKNITITVTDKNNTTKEQTAQITVNAGPTA